MRANVSVVRLAMMAAAALLPAATAQAQGLDERRAQLERQVRAPERGVSQGSPAGADNGNDRDAEIAGAIRNHTGQLEIMDFQLRRLNERVDKLSAAVNDIPAAGTAPGRQR